jgi:predicted aspartyl protease
MLADPVTVVANAPTPQLVLAITRSDGYGSERVDTGANGYAVMTSHTPGKNGDRHYVKISRTKDATNPYTGLTQKQSASVSVSVALPTFGFTTAEMVDLWEALVDYVNDTEVTMTRLLQNQS